MFEQAGNYESKLLRRFAPDRIKRAIRTTVERKAGAMVSALNREFPQGVHRAAELVEQQAAEDDQRVPEHTRALVEAADEVEFIEGLPSIPIVAGETGVEISVKEVNTPVGPASLVAGTFEYGSAASGIPTIPTFRNAADRAAREAGKTVREVRDSLL